MPRRLALLGLTLLLLTGCGRTAVRLQNQVSLSLMGAEERADQNHQVDKAREFVAAQEELKELCGPLQRSTARGLLDEKSDLFDDVMGSITAPFCWGKALELQGKYASDPGFQDPYAQLK